MGAEQPSLLEVTNEIDDKSTRQAALKELMQKDKEIMQKDKEIMQMQKDKRIMEMQKDKDIMRELWHNLISQFDPIGYVIVRL